MAVNYFDGHLPSLGEETEADQELARQFEDTKNKVYDLYDDHALNRALEEVWFFLNIVNKYLADNEPWKLAGQPEKRDRLARVIFQAICSIRGASYLLYPVMPQTSEKIWELLGEDRKPAILLTSDFNFYDFQPARQINRAKAIFPRIDLEEFIRESDSAKKEPAAGGEKETKEKKMDYITYDEFKKMDLRVARVIAAERVEGTKKLLKLQIDLGTEQRQIIAGVAETYSPEDLLNKEFIVIANLQPAVIRGIESQGMLLAAEVDGRAIIPFFDREIPPGTKVK